MVAVIVAMLWVIWVSEMSLRMGTILASGFVVTL